MLVNALPWLLVEDSWSCVAMCERERLCIHSHTCLPRSLQPLAAPFPKFCNMQDGHLASAQSLEELVLDRHFCS